MIQITKARLKGLQKVGVYHGQTTFAPKKSISELLESLLPDEKVIKIASCFYGDKQAAFGITTSRVIILHSSSMGAGVSQKDFEISKITSISTKAGATSTITIQAGSDKIEAKSIIATDLKEITNAARSPESYTSFKLEELFSEETIPKPKKSALGKKVLFGMTGFFFFLLILVGLSDSEPAVSEPTTAEASTSTYSYTVINDDEVQGIKKSLDIRLEKELSEEELYSLANEIKSKIKGQYQNVFISYYLPSMEVGKGAWATSHFTPSLQVKILDFIDHGK